MSVVFCRAKKAANDIMHIGMQWKNMASLFVIIRFNHGNYNRESGRKAVEQFMKYNMPQAIVCANDAMAIGAMERLQQNGYRIPEDVIVTGFDNDELSEFFVPSLTTVDRRQELLGENAVNLLFERSDDVNVQIDTKTIYRESCGCNMQPAIGNQGSENENIRTNVLYMRKRWIH